MAGPDCQQNEHAAHDGEYSEFDQKFAETGAQPITNGLSGAGGGKIKVLVTRQGGIYPNHGLNGHQGVKIERGLVMALTRLIGWFNALFRCRLCWRVTLAVFASIFVIEAAILIPSYQTRERDLLARLDEVYRGRRWSRRRSMSCAMTEPSLSPCWTSCRRIPSSRAEQSTAPTALLSAASARRR
ncbi:MAG: hypothetical protein O7H40_14690 [Gammaproteobacteria bacterium]|nr:hypothetical protein [Gammaproteobacteria bacterium]